MATSRARSLNVSGLRDAVLPFAIPPAAVDEALAMMAGAAHRTDVAEAAVASVVRLPGVRAAAVLSRSDDDGVVVASAGYDCSVMGSGARLPLDSGLPATEALRTGRVIRRGEGPGWCAVPDGRRPAATALLISLDIAPPTDEADVGRLERLSSALGAALRRADANGRERDLLDEVLGRLTPRGPRPPAAGAVVRQLPAGGVLGGDVAMAVADDRGGAWLVVADVCGSGPAAAPGAAVVRAAVHALAPAAAGPADLLHGLDRVLRAEAPEEGFVTAVVARLRDGQLTVASAGHPAPVLLTTDGAAELDLEPGPPLGLLSMEHLPEVTDLSVRPGGTDRLLLYTDGLVDRRTPAGSLDALELCRRLTAGSLDETADRLIALADAYGTGEDDTSLLLAPLLP